MAEPTIAEAVAAIRELSHQLHTLEQFVRQTLTVRVDRISEREAANRLGRSVQWLARQRKLGLLTDARDPDNRNQGSKLLYYSDEIEAWLNGGQDECQRLRRELNRDRT